MTREQLEHAIRAACNVSNDTEVYVFGSQAILGEFPEAPPSLRTSIEVDIQPVNNTEAVDDIDGALGELSSFHMTHGFYVHGVSIEAATLPDGWNGRTVKVSHPTWTQGKTGYCLETHDLAASKLFAYREKDRDFVRVLLAEDMAIPHLLKKRLDIMPIDDQVKERLLLWVTRTVEDL